jgi:fission process protein 1
VQLQTPVFSDFQVMSRRETLTEKAQDEITSLADRNADSTDSDLRYMAYGARLRTALRAGTRYVAYVRPPIPVDSLLYVVKTDYRPVMSGRLFARSYLLPLLLHAMVFLGCISRGARHFIFHVLHSHQCHSDVSYEAYKTHRRGPSPIEAAHFSEPTRVGMVAVKRAVFQSLASMSVHVCFHITLISHLTSHWILTMTHRALPAFTIHTAVNQAKKAFTNVQNKRVKTWGPTISGLAIVPFLPYVFDHPVETATDKAFEWIEKRLVESQESGGKTES